MGWRSTGGAFRAGNYNGPLTSDEGGFASGFAKTFTAGISRASDIIAGEMQAQRDQKREEDLIRLRETLAAQRDAATASRASDKESAKLLKEAQAFATTYGVPIEEAATILQANDGNSRLAGQAIEQERATGLRVNPDSIIPDNVTPNVPPAATPAVPTAIPEAVTPAAEVSSTDDLEQTEVLSDTQPVSAAVQLASRGDIRTDVPLLNSNDPETPLVEQANAVVAELAANPPAPNTEQITYEDRVAAGDTPMAAATIISAGLTRVPEMFKLPDLTTITTLEQAMAIRDTLEARRGVIGGRDEFYQNYAPVLEQRIRSLSVEGLPDLGDMAQQNNRDQLQEFVANGWRNFERTVDPDTLNNHRRRAGELLSSGTSMPNIPAGVDELRAMSRDVQAGVYGADIPTEWQGQLNSALAGAEFLSRYGDRLTVDFIFDDARTERELTGLLNSATASLPSGDPVIRDLQEALRLRGVMPDDVPVPGSLREAEVALARAVAEGADQATIKRLTVDRDAALAAERAGKPVGITAGEYQVLLKNGQSVRTVMQQDGTFLVPGGEAIPQDQILRTLSPEQRQEAIAELTRFRDDRLMPTAGQRQALTTLLPVAMRVADRLERNPALLTTVGSTIPQLFSRVGAELDAISTLASRFGGDPNVPNSFVDPNLFRQGVLSSLGDMSSDAAQHAADVIFLAYQVALSQNDRVTDQDFRTALDQIAKGREPETFIPNMLNRVDDQIRSHDAMVKSALGATEIRLFIDQYGDFPGFSLDELQPFSDFAVSAGFEAEIQRFNELDAKYRGGGSTNTSPPVEETTNQTDAQTDSTFMLITPEVAARSPRLAPYAGKSVRAVQQADGTYIIEVEGEN
jgi:hypothetical protein